MEHGLAVLELAKMMAEERRREASDQRLILRLQRQRRSLDRDRVDAKADDDASRWTLLWTGNGFTGKRVTLVDNVTGERRTGRHHSDWQTALGEVRQARQSS